MQDLSTGEEALVIWDQQPWRDRAGFARLLLYWRLITGEQSFSHHRHGCRNTTPDAGFWSQGDNRAPCSQTGTVEMITEDSQQWDKENMVM